MIFRTKRGAGGYQDGLSGGFSLPGQNAAPIQDGLLGDSACQDKAAQAAFRRR